MLPFETYKRSERLRLWPLQYVLVLYVAATDSDYTVP